MTRNMAATRCLTAVAVFAVCAGIGWCSIVSQSSVEDCAAGDSREPITDDGRLCEKKIYVSLALRNGQGETDSLFANIDQVYEQGESELTRLEKPFRIEISKSNVIASYRLHYIGTANAKPEEDSFFKWSCEDDWYARTSRLPCGKQQDSNGEDIWDSQGFCCKCHVGIYWNERGDHRCGWERVFTRDPGSAHCLTNSELWYNVYDIGPPSLLYNITVRVLSFNGILMNEDGTAIRADWVPVSAFYLTPTKPLGRSKEGQVVAEIQGNLVGAQGPVDFSYKNLLIPSIQHWTNLSNIPEAYSNGPSDWLAVDKHMVDLSGLSCNKVGVSYTGFRQQPGKCNRPSGSCFTNQPLSFWEHDDEVRKENMTGRYMLHNFAEVDESSNPNNTSFIMRLKYNQVFNTFVTLRIDATSLVYVRNIGQGRIVNSYATDFEALQDRGEIVISIENTGDITSDFTVSVLDCGAGIHATSARTVTLDPGVVVDIPFTVQAYRSQGAEYLCDVELYDADYNLLQTASVDFMTNSTCFCFGTCGCTCDADDGGMVGCPDPPEIIVQGGPLYVRVGLLLLESIGLHGIVGVVCGTFLVLGFTKLAFGQILFCRKSKAQVQIEELRAAGIEIPENSPGLVHCSFTCRGAHAAKERYERKLWRLKQLGKKTNKLEDWRNSSYLCSCQDE